jgi:tetratricopeptide (TPR) repeat protein
MTRVPSLFISGLFLLLLIAAVSRDLTEWRLQSGYDAFQRGDVDAALAAWKSAGDRPEVYYNRAVAHARNGEMEKAAHLYIQAAAAGDPVISQRAFYNYGTLLLQQGKASMAESQEKARDLFVAADTQLNAALRFDPRDGDAQHNAAVARDSLAQVNSLIAAKRVKEKVRIHGVPEQRETAKNGAQNVGQSDNPGKPGAEIGSGEAKGKMRSTPEMSRSDADRLLNDARGREALRSATAARTKAGSETPPEKDW